MTLDQIFLDMDGVMVNFCRGVAESFNVPETELTCWALWEPLGISEAEFWEWLNDRSEEWWATLHHYPWAKQLYMFCQSIAPTTILTQPSASGASHAGKKLWLDRMFPGCRYLMGNAKDVVAREGVVLIDDADKNTDTWRIRGGDAITFPRPWNRKSPKSGIAMAYACSQLGAVASTRSYSLTFNSEKEFADHYELFYPRIGMPMPGAVTVICRYGTEYMVAARDFLGRKICSGYHQIMNVAYEEWRHKASKYPSMFDHAEDEPVAA